MNPFDLRGPEFLGFYFVLILVTWVAVVVVRRRGEAAPIPKLNAVDPYLIAYLRSGADEAIRVALVTLVDRGLLEHHDGSWVVDKLAPLHVRRPLEQAILTAASNPLPPGGFYTAPEVGVAAAGLRGEVAKLGLLPGPEHTRRRRIIAAVAATFLGCIALAKIVVAASRGHSNVTYLVLLFLFGAAGANYLARRSRRTVVGNRLIVDLQTLFGGLKERRREIPTGGATNELALLAGIFGLGALEGTALAPMLHLFPAPRAFANDTTSTANSWSSTTSCSSSSSSCSSSSGSSCGSSCGGGGGGCGGCGS